MSPIYNSEQIGTSKIVSMTEGAYVSLDRNDPEYDYTFFIVNNGTGTGEEDHPYTDLYYGSRKVTDLMVVTEPPYNPEYPNGKIYFMPLENEGLVVGYQIYVKFSDIVVPIHTSAVTSVNYDNTDGYPYILVDWHTSENYNITTRIPIINADGSFPAKLVEALSASVQSHLKKEITDASVKWEPIKPIS